MTLRIIAGKFKGRLLKTPKVATTRPTQGMLREAVFNICQTQIDNAIFLDLYAGSGSMGFEALSRGASKVIFIESNKQAIVCIKENIAILGVEEQTTLLPLDAASALKQLKTKFDIVYVDPPYDLSTDSILDLLFKQGCLKEGTSLFLERRYDPRNKTQTTQHQLLTLKSSRKFGTAVLDHYEFWV